MEGVVNLPEGSVNRARRSTTELPEGSSAAQGGRREEGNTKKEYLCSGLKRLPASGSASEEAKTGGGGLGGALGAFAGGSSGRGSGGMCGRGWRRNSRISSSKKLPKGRALPTRFPGCSVGGEELPGKNAWFYDQRKGGGKKRSDGERAVSRGCRGEGVSSA